MGSYVSATAQERAQMLEAIGCKDTADLFAHIPKEVLLSSPLNIPSGMSEMEVGRLVRGIAAKNRVFESIFRGAGAYDHFIPSIVGSVTGKEEFLTAYTPYQAEISQGLLQSIFEYQTMICQLTGMDVSNASVYDGASAAAEAVAMCTDRKRCKALISGAAHPSTIAAVSAYCNGAGTELVVVPTANGKTDRVALAAALDEKVSCVYIQQPSFYGMIEPLEELCEAVHEAGAKLIAGVNPISLGVLKTPGECGADIAVGEGQPLGMPLSFGGPYLGFMTAKTAMARKLPGRIVGETVDSEGQRCFVLTLQAREQHIRREKAASNICSNQAHCALTASVYMAAMGADGIRQAAVLSMSKGAYLAGELEKIGFNRRFEGEFFSEFVTSSPTPVQRVMEVLESNGILGGLPLSGEHSGCILWCCTEKNTKSDIDRLIEILKEVD